jgi:transglutaminase-like putative cysteine protease
MQLSIQHTTQYQYSEPLNYIIQQLRLTPQDGYGQRVKNWSITVNGQLSQHVDTFGNVVHTVVLEGNQTEINLVAKGEVETGFAIKVDEERLPLTIYLRDTKLTTPSSEIKVFAQGFEPITSAEVLVRLSEAILKRVPYVKGATGVYTTAQAGLRGSERGLPRPCTYLYCFAAAVLECRPAMSVVIYLLMMGIY